MKKIEDLDQDFEAPVGSIPATAAQPESQTPTQPLGWEEICELLDSGKPHRLGSGDVLVSATRGRAYATDSAGVERHRDEWLLRR